MINNNFDTKEKKVKGLYFLILKLNYKAIVIKSGTPRRTDI